MNSTALPLLIGAIAWIGLSLTSAPGLADDRGFKPGSPSHERRVALVIGNARYDAAPLKNPGNDARLMATTLRELGFEVTVGYDMSQNRMREAIETFGRQLKGGGVGLFYYAGHALQVHGRNYLVPVDARIEAEAEVDIKSVDLARVLAKMEIADTRMNIVILDACRNTPCVRSFRSLTQGLAFTQAPSGTLIAYATAPGSVANDGAGRHGPYTFALAQRLKTPGLPIERVFKAVRADVRAVTGDRQTPWESSSLEGEFYFLPTPGARTPSPRPLAALPTPRPAPQRVPNGFVRVHAGSFTMGSPQGEKGRKPNETQHRVTLTRDVIIQAREVTQGQWRRVMGNNPSYFGSCGAECPVERVSWYDAVAYLNRLSELEGLEACYTMEGCRGAPGTGCALSSNEGKHCQDGYRCAVRFKGLGCEGYRLPTEAEWEYAARAGEVGAHHGRLRDVAWFSFNSGEQPWPVGRKTPNSWGLYDTIGNVWEWTHDWYAPYPAGDARDPLGPASGTTRVTRGSSWFNHATFCRAGYRGRVTPAGRFYYVGFRAARTSL